MRGFLNAKMCIIALIVLTGFGMGGYFYVRLLQCSRATKVNLYNYVALDSKVLIETTHFPILLSVCKPFSIYLQDSVYTIPYVVTLFSPYANKMKQVLVSYASIAPDEQLLCAMVLPGERTDKWMESYLPIGVASRTVNYRGQRIRVFPLYDGRFVNVYSGQGYVISSLKLHLLYRAIDVCLNRRHLFVNLQFKRAFNLNQETDLATVYLRDGKRWYSMNPLFYGRMVLLEGNEAEKGTSLDSRALKVADTLCGKHYMLVHQTINTNNDFFPLLKLIMN